MKIKRSGAKYSNIVSIGEMLKKKQAETGLEYLPLNRGVNAVCNIDLSEVIPLIDFNSNEIQVYPANNGISSLKKAVNQHFFLEKAKEDDIVITHGGMGSLDLVLDMLDVEKVYFAKYYWGSYRNVSIIHSKNYDYYESFSFLRENAAQLKGNAVIICDPNNPIGDTYPDEEILELVRLLNDNGVIVLFDSPYRKLFSDESDTMYADLLDFENVIIMESFSKSFGLSGQRMGFVHSTNADFIHEFGVRMLYVANGVNAFAQVLVEKLITTSQGQKATEQFRKKTVDDITKNIQFLSDQGLLAEEFYRDSQPVGIFVVVNQTENQLLEHRIGSVKLSYFTNLDKEYADKFARICVSVPHEKFVEFFAPVAKETQSERAVAA